MASDNIFDVKYIVEGDGIYVDKPYVNGFRLNTLIMPKEVFIEAYNKYILDKE